MTKQDEDKFRTGLSGCTKPEAICLDECMYRIRSKMDISGFSTSFFKYAVIHDVGMSKNMAVINVYFFHRNYGKEA